MPERRHPRNHLAQPGTHDRAECIGLLLLQVEQQSTRLMAAGDGDRLGDLRGDAVRRRHPGVGIGPEPLVGAGERGDEQGCLVREVSVQPGARHACLLCDLDDGRPSDPTEPQTRLRGDEEAVPGGRQFPLSGVGGLPGITPRPTHDMT